MSDKDSLVVLWTSGDKEVAMNMVFMYTLNSKLHGWWEDVKFVIWGPSAGLVSSDGEVQSKILELDDVGVELEACKACAEDYDAVDDLESMGVDVKYMGEPFTEYIKSDMNVVTL